MQGVLCKAWRIAPRETLTSQFRNRHQEEEKRQIDKLMSAEFSLDRAR